MATRACGGRCPLSRASDRRRGGGGHCWQDWGPSLVCGCERTGVTRALLPSAPSLEWPQQSRKRAVNPSISIGRDLGKRSPDFLGPVVCATKQRSHTVRRGPRRKKELIKWLWCTARPAPALLCFCFLVCLCVFPLHMEKSWSPCLP